MRMSDAVAKAARSEWLAVAARGLTVILCLLGVPFLIWVVTTVNTLDKDMAVSKVRDSQQDQTVRALGEALGGLKTQRDADAKSNNDLQIAIGRALEKLDGQGRSLARIEAFIDRQPNRP